VDDGVSVVVDDEDIMEDVVDDAVWMDEFARSEAVVGFVAPEDMNLLLAV
jgi:hypothetical protein